MGHAYTIFPEVIEVPLIIHLPPALASAVTFDPRAVAFLTDITPTLYYSLGHKPIARNDIFGRPLLTERLEEQTPYLRDSYLIVSSYGPVYGILSNEGHSLYIADGVNFKEYFFELREGSADTSKEVTDTLRARYQQEIRERVAEINRFYQFQPPPAQ
jgi:arylsulfatase A-like enzyme